LFDYPILVVCSRAGDRARSRPCVHGDAEFLADRAELLLVLVQFTLIINRMRELGLLATQSRVWARVNRTRLITRKTADLTREGQWRGRESPVLPIGRAW
jgi:hypothetical protein